MLSRFVRSQAPSALRRLVVVREFGVVDSLFTMFAFLVAESGACGAGRWGAARAHSRPARARRRNGADALAGAALEA